MIKMQHLKIISLAALVGLAGCSSNSERSSINQIAAIGGQVVVSLKNRGLKNEPAPVVKITPGQLARTKVAALQVNPEKIGGSDFLKRIAVRNDDLPGTVSVWQGAGNAQLFVRGGVLIGTRGLGGDMISSDATQTVLAVSGARSGGGERRYIMSDGGYSEVEVVLRCDIDNLGRQDTQVVNFSYHTIHLRETCIGGAGDRTRIINSYWVQPGSGTVRRSRQWVGPYSGYFELILLKN